MPCSKFTNRDLVIPAIILICSLTVAQDKVSTDYDLSADDLEGHEEGEFGESDISEPVAVTLRPTAYPPDRANVYPYKKEQAPPFHFAVWDESGNICILAKLEASFTITYESKYGKQQMIDRLDSDAKVDGRCESFLDEKPVMDFKWRGGFTFRLIFKQVKKADTLDAVVV